MSEISCLWLKMQGSAKICYLLPSCSSSWVGYQTSYLLQSYWYVDWDRLKGHSFIRETCSFSIKKHPHSSIWIFNYLFHINDYTYDLASFFNFRFISLTLFFNFIENFEFHRQDFNEVQTRIIQIEIFMISKTWRKSISKVITRS